MGAGSTLIYRLEVPNPQGLDNKQLFLTNHDLEPVEEGRRLWSKRNFIFFWIADGFNLNTWYIASAMLPALTWWQAWICVWLGRPTVCLTEYTFTGIFVAMGARPGGVYHISFPVFCRSSFGIFGSLWPVLNRAVMACVWTGVQSWIGGQCVTILLRSLAPQYRDLPNSLPASSGTTTRDFLSFFLFILLHIPCVWQPPHKIRHLFTVKSVVAPISGLMYFGWIVKLAGGIGPIIHQPGTATGSDKGWQMIIGIMSAIANFATLMCNASDFSRFAKKPSHAVLPQMIAIPATFGIVSFFGILVASSSSVLFSQPIWDPLELLGRILDQDPHNSGNRALAFFISAGFIIAQLGTNIAANTISAGTDLTALLPRFLNIRRGGFIAVAVAFAMCPWNLLKSSSMFTTYLSAYSVFLSAIIGVMFCDYFWVRRGYLEIPELYTYGQQSRSWYWKGINYRAYVAYVCGIIPNAPGFGGAVGAAKVPIGATHVYNLNFFVGFIVSSLIYAGLCWIHPIPGMVKQGWAEQKGFEPEDHSSTPEMVYVGEDDIKDKGSDV